MDSNHRSQDYESCMLTTALSHIQINKTKNQYDFMKNISLCYASARDGALATSLCNKILRLV